MSSLKMTFSLASLVLVMAFAFIAMPVMAHEGDAAVNLREHGHPTEVLDALDGPDVGEVAGDNVGEGTVPGHGVHPDPSISLKKGANVRGDKVMIAADAADAAKLAPISFTIVVDFVIDVNAGDGINGTEIAVATDDLLEAADLNVRIFDNKGASLFNSPSSSPNLTAVGDTPAAPAATEVEFVVTRVEKSNSKFEVTFTLGEMLQPNGKDKDAKEQLIFQVQVPANAALGFQKPSGFADVDGAASYESDTENFTLVKALGTDTSKAVEVELSGMPSLTDAFIVTFTSNFKNTDGEVVGKAFTLTPGDIEFVGAYPVSDSLTAIPVIAPRVAGSIWEVVVVPKPSVRQVSVSLKSGSANVKAAEGKGTVATSSIVLNSIVAEPGASDQARFDITITFASQLPVGTDLKAADLAVTPEDDKTTTTVNEAAKIIGEPVAQGLDRAVWEVEIEPFKSMVTTVDLSDAGKVKFDTAAGYMKLTVKTKAVQDASIVGAPPTATITVTNPMQAGNKGTFDIRVAFVPATGESAVTGFDHMDLMVVDSSTPAKSVPVMVAMGTEANPIDDPLMADNLYVATLEYDTRHNFMLPLKVTIDQMEMKTHNPMESDDVGAAPPGTPPAAKAQATFSGTLSLTGQSIITVTFDKAVTGLDKDDFTVTGGDASFVRVKPNLTTAMANKVWEVAIDADESPFTESITVTIATTSKLAEPAMTMGSLTRQVAVGTLSSIAAPTGANDTAAFIVSFTFAAALPDSVSLMKTDIKVTPTTATVGTPVASPADAKIWQVLITPTATMDTKIELSDTGKLRFDYSGAAVTVMKKGPAITPGDITATYDAATMTTTLTGTIGANSPTDSTSGFAVVGHAALPDLEEFFDIGGTIGLHDADSADGDDDNSREVIISEILWGLDFGATAIAHQKQWAVY